MGQEQLWFTRPPRSSGATTIPWDVRPRVRISRISACQVRRWVSESNTARVRARHIWALRTMLRAPISLVPARRPHAHQGHQVLLERGMPTSPHHIIPTVTPSAVYPVPLGDCICRLPFVTNEPSSSSGRVCGLEQPPSVPPLGCCVSKGTRVQWPND